MRTVGLLVASNVFMTFAWYGHLRFTNKPLWMAILGSWLIAFFEYCLQVPANRAGYGAMSGYQLKILQEVITLLVFLVFAWFWLGERLRPNHVVAFVFLLCAAAAAFWDKLGR